MIFLNNQTMTKDKEKKVKAVASKYGAEQIQVLEALEPVRKRPGHRGLVVLTLGLDYSKIIL